LLESLDFAHRQSIESADVIEGLIIEQIFEQERRVKSDMALSYDQIFVEFLKSLD